MTVVRACASLVGWGAPGTRVGNAMLRRAVDGMQFTTARSGDRFPAQPNAYQYCQNQLETDFVRAWSNNANDFKKCLYVQEVLRRFGVLDLIVLVMAILLVAASICTERQQQLFNAHLRKMLLPPVWRDPRAAVFKLIECLMGAVLPFVCLAMILLLFNNPDGLTASSTLLTGVAVTFVTLIDDELPKVVLSDVDRKAVDHFAEASGEKRLLVVNRRKALANSAVCLVLCLLMVMMASHSSCDELFTGCYGLALLTPVCASLAEEIVAIPYTLHLARLAADEAERSAKRELSRSATDADTVAAVASDVVTTLSSRQGLWVIAETFFSAAVTAGLQTGAMILILRVAFEIYLFDATGLTSLGNLLPNGQCPDIASLWPASSSADCP